MLLQIEGLTKRYQEKVVVNNFSLEIEPGEIVGLLGPNGAGKTTAFYMTMGLIPSDRGRLYFKGEDITQLPMHARAHLGMGYLAQEPSIFRTMNVEDNILCALELLPYSKQERFARLEELLCELSLTPLRKIKASKLSGGERRKLEITRALVINPQLLLLDEPFANVDPITIYEVKKIMMHLRKKGISVLITDHNAREILSFVDRSYLMNKGEILAHGDVSSLLSNDIVKKHYLGEEFTL